MLKSFVKKQINTILSSRNLFPTTLTKKEEVLTVLKSLYPVATEVPLIRMGPNGDGGYVVPDDLQGITACFSPGVSFVSGFESDCAKRGMEVYLADKSVDGPAEQNEKFHFIKKYIGSFNSDDFVTVDSWVSESMKGDTSDLLLQMDIEGFEYEVLLNISETGMSRFRIMVIEFHELDQLWNKPYFTLISRSIEKILQTHYCVHIHPNNSFVPTVRDGIEIPKVMEFTFIRKDRVKSTTPRTDFPHALDFDNTTNPTVVLPSSWFQSK